MNFAGKLRNMMVGRYGADQFNLVLVGFSLGISFLSQLFRLRYVGWLSTLLLLYAIFRMFSKNISRRSDENRMFLLFWNPIRNWFSSRAAALRDRKTHRHLKCPKCSQKIRVPKGRGNITITCPSCHAEFTRKS